MASLVSVDRDGGRGGGPRKSRKRLSSVGGRSDTPTQAKAKARRKRQKTSEEEALEDLIFDPSFDSVVSTFKTADFEDDLEAVAEADNAAGSGSDSDSDSDAQSDGEFEDESRLAPAWTDSDDENVAIDLTKTDRLRKLRKTPDEQWISGPEYSQRLRNMYISLHPTPMWARIPKEPPSDSSFLQSTESLSSKPTTLPPKFLEIVRLKDANMQDQSKGVITSLQFHPNGRVMLVSSLDKTLRLFQADGLQNTKLQGAVFDNTPIHCARFTPDGRHVVVSGRRKYFFCFDSESGEVERIHRISGRQEKSLENFEISPKGNLIAFIGTGGVVILVSLLTKQWVANLKMNGTASCVAFSASGDELFAVGSDGEVYIWDVDTRECIRRHRDYGCVNGTSIAVSPCGRYYATGSDSGVVNLYARNDESSRANPTPLKEFTNLTTSIDFIQFNHSGELLAFGSHRKKDSFRLAHVESRMVFPNWPTSNTPLHYVTQCAFSPNSGFLTVGNARGVTLMYRLPFYSES